MSNFKFALKLDLSQFSEGLKSATKLAVIGSKQIAKILSGLKADIDEKEFDKELDHLKKKIKKLDSETIDIPVEIETKDAGNAIDKITQKMKKNKTVIGNLKSMATEYGLALQGVSTIYHTISGMVDIFVEKAEAQEKAEQKVEQAVKQTGEAAGFSAGELKNMASALQESSIFGDEDILNNVTAQLLTFTNITGEQFSRTQQAAMDLSTVLDGDLKSASIQLGKALNDPIANLSALSRSGIQFSSEQKELVKSLWEAGRQAEAQSVILDELNIQYGGQAAAMAGTYSGALKQFSNSFGDLQEIIGMKILPVLGSFASTMKDIITVPLSEKLREQKLEFNALMVSLMDTNIAETTKKELIEEINSKYGSYVKNINLETAEYADLEKILIRANEEIEKKIRAAAVEEVLAKQKKKLLKANKSLIAATIRLEKEQAKEYPGLDSLQAHTKAIELSKEKVADLEDEYKLLYNRLVNNGFIPEETETEIEETNEKIEKLVTTISNIPAIELDVVLAPDIAVGGDVDAMISSQIKANNDKQVKANEKMLSKKLANQKEYYEKVNFGDENYFKWKQRQNERAIDEMDISEDKKLRLKEEALAELQAKEDNYLENRQAKIDADIEKEQEKRLAMSENLASAMNEAMEELFYNNQERTAEEIGLDLELSAINHQEKMAQINQQLALERKGTEEYRKLELEKRKIDLAYNKQKAKLQKEQEDSERNSTQRMLEVFKAGVKEAIGILAFEAMGHAMKWVIKKVPPPFSFLLAPIAGATAFSLINAVASKFAYGGLVMEEDDKNFLQQFVPPGEDVLIGVRKGEYVIQEPAVRKYFPIIESINEMRYAAGGMIGDIPRSTWSAESDDYLPLILGEIRNSIQAMNLNLVEKKLNVNIVIETTDPETKIRNDELTKEVMNAAGDDLARV